MALNHIFNLLFLKFYFLLYFLLSVTHEREAVKVELNQASNIRSNYFASTDFSFKLFFRIREMNPLPAVVAAEIIWCVEFVNILSHFKRFSTT